jgi:signal transduction histidine kinase
MRRFFKNILFALIAMPWLILARAQEVLPAEITTVRELRKLTPEQASESLPVRITGVVTYIEKLRSMAFIQDETGGAFFNPGNGWGKAPNSRSVDVAAGDLVEIRGVTTPGNFAPYIQRIPPDLVEAKTLGKAPFPDPVRVESGRLFDAQLDGLWVEVEGVVRTMHLFENRLLLEMTNGLEDFTVAVFGEWQRDKLPRHLDGSRIRALGVFGSIPDRQRRLIGVRVYSQSIDLIEVLDPGAEEAFASPPVQARDLLRYRTDPSDRVHVRGIVTAAFPGQRLFMRSDGIPLTVITQETRLPVPGTTVDVVGYPFLEDQSPVIQTALIRSGKTTKVPEPISATPSELAQTKFHGQLVRTEARLVDQFVSGRDLILLATDGGHTFSAHLKLADGASPPKLPLDGWIDFTGISQIEQDPNITPPEPWRKPSEGNIRGFNLLLRGPADLKVIRHPPFWTSGRVLAAASVLAAALGLTFIWVLMLRHKVRQQTSVIASKIESERVSEERSRIARELHDTVEQELAGIGLQLDLARARVEQNPDRVRAALDLAMRMLRRTQQETRSSIQDLRSGRLERTNLAAALFDLVRQIGEESETPIVANIDPLPSGVPVIVEHNLLRIAQEALNNALQHSDATEIGISFKVTDRFLVLEITDNGKGFDPTINKPGHFGLQGMRERAVKIGAACQITTKPGEGTRIRAELPFDKKS